MLLSNQPQTTNRLPLIRQQVQVFFNYDVHFTEDVFNPSNPLLAKVLAADAEKGSKRAIAVIDSGVLAVHPHLIEDIQAYFQHHDKLTLCTTPVSVPGGEAAKNNPELVESLQQQINHAGLCRHSYVLAIGGGSVLDLIGYAAATAHRGIRLVRIPTTVLAQNDAGIGVKNGVNAFGQKNFLGTFAPPFAVINDAQFLTTLDDRDWRSGIAEAIKVALIKDSAFFHWIAAQAIPLGQRNREAMQQLVYRCAQLHLDHIATSGDPFELGSSRPLDFGHWAAHRLERLTHYQLRHGEAVAIGIALDSTYAYLQGLLHRDDWQRILQTLQVLQFRLYVPELSAHLEAPHHPESLLGGLAEFQAHLGGELTIMLLQGIGQGREVHQVNHSGYRQAIAHLQALEGASS